MQTTRLFSLLWRSLAVLLIAMPFCFVSCSDDDADNPEVPPYTEIEDEDVDLPPTADALTVKSTQKTYIFPGEYSGAGLALTRRIANSAPMLDNTVKNVILHDSYASVLTDNDAKGITAIIAQGGGVVLCSPTRKGVDAFVKKLQAAIAVFGKSPSDVTPTDEGISALQRISNMQVGDDGMIQPSFEPDNDTNGILGDIVAIKGNRKYFVDDSSEPLIMTSNVIEFDENGNDSIVGAENSVTLSDDTPTDYAIGVQGDGIAEWLDEADDTQQLLAEGRQAVQSATNDDAQTILLNEANAQHATHSFLASVRKDKQEEVKINYKIWAVHDINDGSDYYLVHQTAYCYNSQLKCGPTNERSWKINVQDFFRDVNHDFKRYPKGPHAYWLYLGRFATQAKFCDLKNGESLEISDVSPVNNMSSGTHYESTMEKEIKMGISLSAKPTISLNRGVKISQKWSYDIADLSYSFTYGQGRDHNTPKWEYTAGVHPKVYKKKEVNTVYVYHTLAKDGLTKDFTAEHSWTWRVTNAKKAYSFQSSLDIDLNALWQGTVHKFWKGGDVITSGIKPFKMSSNVTINLSQPARCMQKWTMFMQENDKETIEYLKEYFPDVWVTLFYLNTVNASDRLLVDQYINSIIERLESKQQQLDDAHIKDFTLKWSLATSSDTYRTYKHEAKWK